MVNWNGMKKLLHGIELEPTRLLNVWKEQDYVFYK